MRFRILLEVPLLCSLFYSCSDLHKNAHNQPPEHKFHITKEQVKEAREKGDYAQAARWQLLLNREKELRELSPNESEQSINTKYDLLEKNLEKEIADYEKDERLNRIPKNSFYNAATGGKYKFSKKNNRDGYYKGPHYTSVYDELEIDAVKKVMKDFKPLYINETRDADGDLVFMRVTALERPWSGYWYPFSDKILFEGENAPLKKFDLLMEKKGRCVSDDKNPGICLSVVEAALKRLDSMSSEKWEGYCGGRAFAAIKVKEPTKPLTIDGITFSIADQKGIHTFAHARYPNKIYGEIFRGSAETDGTYQDMRPEAFHRSVEYLLGEKKRAFVIDHTAGVEIWNQPLYDYKWKIEKDPDIENAFVVKAYAYLVKERNFENNRLTHAGDIVVRLYHYRLYVNKQDIVGGKYKVIAGQWVGESFIDHPDNIRYLRSKRPPVSNNPIFNQHVASYRAFFIKSSP